MLSASASRSRTTRTDLSADDRYWTKTGRAADFEDVPHTVTVTVRSRLVRDWPVDLIGGALASGWVSLTGSEGGASPTGCAGCCAAARPAAPRYRSRWHCGSPGRRPPCRTSTTRR
ncbi:hypothetical protein NKH18_50415 [Streptomyces sp. M10(2022)]